MIKWTCLKEIKCMGDYPLWSAVDMSSIYCKITGDSCKFMHYLAIRKSTEHIITTQHASE